MDSLWDYTKHSIKGTEVRQHPTGREYHLCLHFNQGSLKSSGRLYPSSWQLGCSLLVNITAGLQNSQKSNGTHTDMFLRQKHGDRSLKLTLPRMHFVASSKGARTTKLISQPICSLLYFQKCPQFLSVQTRLLSFVW